MEVSSGLHKGASGKIMGHQLGVGSTRHQERCPDGVHQHHIFASLVLDSLLGLGLLGRCSPDASCT